LLFKRNLHRYAGAAENARRTTSPKAAAAAFAAAWAPYLVGTSPSSTSFNIS
jgi:hypothetical protein